MAEEQGWMVAEEQGRSSDGGGEWVDGGGGAGEDGGGGAAVDGGGELGFRDGGGGAGVDGGGGAEVDGGGELGFRDGGGIGASAGRRHGGGRPGGGEVDEGCDGVDDGGGDEARAALAGNRWGESGGGGFDLFWQTEAGRGARLRKREREGRKFCLTPASTYAECSVFAECKTEALGTKIIFKFLF